MKNENLKFLLKQRKKNLLDFVKQKKRKIMNTELIKLLVYKDYFTDFYYLDYETFINKIKELKDK